MDPSVPPTKTAERIADQLRAQIIRRELADGDHLPFEADLCERFATSRPTMREAFRILEAEGLLSIRRGGRRGPLVRAPDPSLIARRVGLLLQYQGVDLAAVYDTFLTVVPECARNLARSHSDDDLAALRAQRDRCVVAATDVDGAVFLEESTAFLLLVVARGGNPVQALVTQMLADVLRAHRAAMSAYFTAKPRVRARRAAEVLDSTASIIAMIDAGDVEVGDLLLRALDSHVRKALEVPMGAVQLV
jgi:GntR family transcriptional regulator, transcriptional repressor for pyruvate dehydrogenase complex